MKMGILDSVFNILTLGRYGLLLSTLDTTISNTKQLANHVTALYERLDGIESYLSEDGDGCNCEEDDNTKLKMN